MELHFSIDGAFMTNLAREQFYSNHQLAKAINLLWNCTVNDQMTDTEHLLLCLEIIAGSKSIVGIYPGDDYKVIDTPDSDLTIQDLISEIDNMQKTIDEQTDDYNKLIAKYLFICEQLSDDKLRSIDREYMNEYDEHLFDLPEKYPTATLIDIDKYNKENIVDSYLSRAKNARDDDYGWLEPDGTYHAVEWGDHSKWAMEYTNNHYPFKDYAHMYWKTDANGKRHHYVCGDFLVYVLGWVLLDNPTQGIATPKYDPARRLTKAQKEFLYDYYIERNLNSRANAIWQED